MPGLAAPGPAPARYGPGRVVAVRRRLAVGTAGGYRVVMAETLTLTLTVEPRGPAGAFVLSDEQVAAVGGDAQARAAFEALAYTHRKEFARWVGDAKRDTTRAQRIAKTLEMLRAGQHR